MILRRDEKCTSDLRNVLFQVVWNSRMNVDHDDPEIQSVDVLLVYEVCVEGDEDSKFLLSGGKDRVIIIVRPPSVLSGHHLMALRKLDAKRMRNVVVEQNLHAGTRSSLSFPSLNVCRYTSHTRSGSMS